MGAGSGVRGQGYGGEGGVPQPRRVCGTAEGLLAKAPLPSMMSSRAVGPSF